MNTVSEEFVKDLERLTSLGFSLEMAAYEAGLLNQMLPDEVDEYLNELKEGRL